MSEQLYIGIMSGTSLDAIDTVLVDLQGNTVELLCTAEYKFPEKLRHQLTSLINEPDAVSLDYLGSADRELGAAYAAAVTHLLTKANAPASAIKAIGCHGQTIRHRPDTTPPFTLQIGDAATLAATTGITVVNDFRSADIALGGQGAPLVPAFHRHVFANSGCDRAVLNIGGIANITILKHDGHTSGFDTGPGNTLLDLWCEQHLGKRYDENGNWAREGTVIDNLLEAMLADPYFSQDAPKSTGREYFNAAWLTRHTASILPAPQAVDVQATLTELTARSVATALKQHAPAAEIYLCGGGAHNDFLVTRLATHLEQPQVFTTAELGITPDWVEATAFAWLAQARLQGDYGNVPAVTGASRSAVLGAITAP